MPRIVFFLLALTLYLSFDGYVFNGLRSLFGSNLVFYSSYWIISLAVILGFYLAYLDFSRKKREIRSEVTNLIIGIGFSILVGKIVFAGLLFIQDVVRFLMGAISYFGSLFESQIYFMPERPAFIVLISLVLTCIPMFSMIYGVLFGKYNYQVETIQLNFTNLPAAFNGLRLVQISDIHAGSFDNLKRIEKGVEIIQKLKADIIVFTGDLVNSLKEEIDPFLPAFSKLSAPLGMYSILGNHDYYGMYRVGKDMEARRLYMDDFTLKHQTIGFQLLKNDSVTIQKDGNSIFIVGVENWGIGPFPKTGDLTRALEKVPKDGFTILLSHDPTHWEHHVLPHSKHVDLTLSGHTHGMQFGIKIGNLRWSPVQYRYKNWIGLYQQMEQYLYVNRGFGFLAWPGRVGMSPEITLFELNRTDPTPLS